MTFPFKFESSNGDTWVIDCRASGCSVPASQRNLQPFVSRLQPVSKMNFRQNITFFLFILSLCTLPGCIQSFGTVVESPMSDGMELNSSSLDWGRCGIEFHEDFNQARNVAVEEKKPMLLFFYSPNCVFSRQMLKETLCDEEITKLSRQFICVKINESRQREICEEYDVQGTPTIQFMNPQGILLQRLTAKRSPNQLLLQMQITIESLAARK